MKLRLVLLGLLVVLWTYGAVAPVRAIVIRHDVNDARYLQQEGAYPAVFDFFDQRGGVGTMIAPQWALTVAHVAQDVPQGHGVSIGSETYRIQQVVLHPTWGSESFVDIGLVQLDRPVSNVTPISVYAGDGERGQTVTFVGRGDTGTGQTGPMTRDHRLRAATNRVERVEGDILVFRFDAPTDENATPLEGISGPGDSGGPALIESADTLYVAGLSVAQDSAGRERGTYGVWEFYTRVSPQVEWIEATIQSSPEAPQANAANTSWGLIIGLVALALLLLGLIGWWLRRTNAPR